MTQAQAFIEKVELRLKLWKPELESYTPHRIGSYDPDRAISARKEFFQFQAKKQGNGSTVAPPKPRITEVATGRTWEKAKDFCDERKCTWDRFDSMRKKGLLMVEGIKSGTPVILTHVPTGQVWESLAKAAEDLGIDTSTLKARIKRSPKDWRKE